MVSIGSEGGNCFLRRWAGLAALLLAALCLWCGGARADVVWPEETAGQRLLKQYAAQADAFLIQQGEPGINSLFEAYRSFAVFGITQEPNAEVPEQVEITARLFENTLNSLEVRVSDFGRFPRIAASFIMALNPESMTLEDALRVPTERMQKAAKSPDTSFEDQVESLNGTQPYIYYAYYYDQYHDGVSWLQMTIIFPMEGYWDGYGILSGAEVTRGPDTYSDHSSDYVGYDSEDDFVHYEFFMTPTPEPDSAAGQGR